jgi:1-aminocyclopropane-1-carboxylate deaminase/D-cysteine desulfhydrase-like pyridoxal-dependent ACC family enzyme
MPTGMSVGEGIMCTSPKEWDRPVAGPEIQALLYGLPRVSLANQPTPLDDCRRLSASLPGPRILIKRDDLTGLAAGGNKARMLEFLMGDVVSGGYDTVITSAPTQSNFCRMVAAASARLGVKAILLLRCEGPEKVQANLLIDDLVGAEIRMVPMTNVNSTDQTDAMMEDIAAALRAQGRKPWVANLRRASAYAAVSYLDATRELRAQLGALNTKADYVFITTCSGGTQGGVVMGSRLMNMAMKVVGSRMRDKKEDLYPLVRRAIQDASELLCIKVPLQQDDIVVIDEYTGRGTSDITEGCLEAIRLVAETEGILLDPVYTGKTMAALIDHIRTGRIHAEETVVFWHTGGLPMVFLYGDQLTSVETMF